MASLIATKMKKFFSWGERKKDKHTSIEDIFQFELLTVKLCAGFMFGGNKYICLLYRAVIIIWAKYSQASFQMSFQDSLHTSLSEPVLMNLRFFILFYLAANILASITTLMSSSTFYKSLWIPLQKRFDKAYLKSIKVVTIDVDNKNDYDEGPYFESPFSATSATSMIDTESSASSSGIVSGGTASNQCPSSMLGTLGSVKDGGCCRGDFDKPPASNPASLTGSRSRSAWISLARTVKLINSISKITLIKSFLACYLSLGVASSFIVNEYSKIDDCGLNKNFVINETTATDLAVMTRILGAVVYKREVNQQEFLSISSNITNNSQNLLSSIQDTNATTTTTTRRPAIGNRSYAPRRYARPAACGRARSKHLMLKSVTSNTFYYAWTILRHILNSVANFYQIYGHVVVTLLITTALTDMLRRVNEQECIVTALQGLDHSGFQTYKQNDSAIDRERYMLYGIFLPTTDILIHARDILWVLKSSLSFDYVAIQCHDVSQLIVLSGSILALVSAKSKLGWLIIFSYEYIQVNLSMILTRITYHWLHTEARKIRHLNEQRVIACNIILNKHELDFNICDPQSSQDRGQDSPDVHTCLTKFEYYKQVAIMNYRLADQIEELWPCEWFVPDLGSCLALNLFVITFVATLQQMVEASNSKGMGGILD